LFLIIFSFFFSRSIVERREIDLVTAVAGSADTLALNGRRAREHLQVLVDAQGRLDEGRSSEVVRVFAFEKGKHSERVGDGARELRGRVGVGRTRGDTCRVEGAKEVVLGTKAEGLGEEPELRVEEGKALCAGAVLVPFVRPEGVELGRVEVGPELVHLASDGGDEGRIEGLRIVAVGRVASVVVVWPETVEGERVNVARDLALVLSFSGADARCPLLDEKEEVPRVVLRFRDDLVLVLVQVVGRCGGGNQREEESHKGQGEEKRLVHCENGEEKGFFFVGSSTEVVK